MFEVLQVISPGCGATWQDAGRAGLKRFGVPPGGWMDERAAQTANRLVGNSDGVVVIELALQGARFRVLRDGWLAVAGASMGWTPGTRRRVERGEHLDFTRHNSGVYAYVAAPGGWAAPVILGSASVSARSGIGRGLAVGDVLSCLSDPARDSRQPVGGSEDGAPYPGSVDVRVWRAPQWGIFAAPERAEFFATAWTVSARSDRMGVRLEGARIGTSEARMPSEPVLPGSVQITGDGQPVVTMRDGPTVGGYPKMVWLDEEACRRVAQVPPGGRVRFIEPRE